MATAIAEALRAQSHVVFLAEDSIPIGANWPQCIDQELARANYVILLLSPEAAASEMVVEELRKAVELRANTGRPRLLPVRMNVTDAQILYDVRGYLSRIQHATWTSESDTEDLIRELLGAITVGIDLDERAPTPIPPEPVPDEIAHPSPVAIPELPTGQVPRDSAFYVERENVDANCLSYVCTQHALLRIRGARQMGKTSLLSRLTRHGKEKGALTVTITLQLAEQTILKDLSRLLGWLCAIVSDKLGMAPKDWQPERLGARATCTQYFERHILPNLSAPLILSFDEVDLVFEHVDVAPDFLSMLRAWYDAGNADEGGWDKLSLIIAHSTEPYAVLPVELRQSPFENVIGKDVSLTDFTAVEVAGLVGKHGLNGDATISPRIMEAFGGQPYLVRRALYEIYQGTPLATLLEQTANGEGPLRDHLRRYQWILQQHPDLRAAFKHLVERGRAVASTPVFSRLEALGLARISDRHATLRCGIYREYFNGRLHD